MFGYDLCVCVCVKIESLKMNKLKLSSNLTSKREKNEKLNSHYQKKSSIDYHLYEIENWFSTKKQFGKKILWRLAFGVQGIPICLFCLMSKMMEDN